ncbi:type II secretion system inner membrane protein GspF [Marinimicrobium alkaliphilum]|uniref:type II secretion system inner membrane protein GspF n=1 Tax=Marinimicrobium alkaliphilum TaxID=2202654 RepID=UPI000DB90B11|nr:type II secretion system inner membrane protein GspF [Marinimicrobium alkaliphilum]
MGAYSYRALNEAGKTVKGILEGDSERQVRTQLRAKKLKPLDVESASAGARADKPSQGFDLKLFRRGVRTKINAKDLSLMTRQLASLVKSGLPLDEALQATARQQQKPNNERILLQVRAKVLEGFSLAQALNENPGAFNDMYRAMVRAGESSGYLGPVLERLAEYTQKSQIIQSKLRSATIYPAVLLTFALLVIVALMAFVVPDLIGIFQHQETQLPLLTRMLIATSDFVVGYGVYVLIAIIGAVWGVKRLLRAPKRLRTWHAWQLKLPVMGNLVRQINSSRFASTLGLLTNSGVPLLQALNIAGQVMTNKILQENVQEVAEAVHEGTSLHKAMNNVGGFPPLLVQLVSSGESNGTLPEQLENAAEDQERELEMMLGVAMGLLEPLTVVFMGGAVGLIVLAILMPIFEMNTLI